MKKAELQILKNEFGIYYIADKNGNVQYHEGTKILASKNIECLKQYIKDFK